jgi:hypothetical protein
MRARMLAYALPIDDWSYNANPKLQTTTRTQRFDWHIWSITRQYSNLHRHGSPMKELQ